MPRHDRERDSGRSRTNRSRPRLAGLGASGSASKSRRRRYRQGVDGSWRFGTRQAGCRGVAVCRSPPLDGLLCCGGLGRQRSRLAGRSARSSLVRGRCSPGRQTWREHARGAHPARRSFKLARTPRWRSNLKSGGICQPPLFGTIAVAAPAHRLLVSGPTYATSAEQISTERPCSASEDDQNPRYW